MWWCELAGSHSTPLWFVFCQRGGPLPASPHRGQAKSQCQPHQTPPPTPPRAWVEWGAPESVQVLGEVPKHSNQCESGAKGGNMEGWEVPSPPPGRRAWLWVDSEPWAACSQSGLALNFGGSSTQPMFLSLGTGPSGPDNSAVGLSVRCGMLLSLCPLDVSTSSCVSRCPGVGEGGANQPSLEPLGYTHQGAFPCEATVPFSIRKGSDHLVQTLLFPE